MSRDAGAGVGGRGREYGMSAGGDSVLVRVGAVSAAVGDDGSTWRGRETA